MILRNFHRLSNDCRRPSVLPVDAKVDRGGLIASLRATTFPSLFGRGWYGRNLRTPTDRASNKRLIDPGKAHGAPLFQPAREHHRSRSASAPIRERPVAMDSSSEPAAILSLSNRRSKIARTAGTKDEPPVRKTRSI